MFTIRAVDNHGDMVKVEDVQVIIIRDNTMLCYSDKASAFDDNIKASIPVEAYTITIV